MLVRLLSVLGSELPVFEHVNVVELGDALLQSEVHALFHRLGVALPFSEKVGFTDVELSLQLVDEAAELQVFLPLDLRCAHPSALAEAAVGAIQRDGW